MVWGLCTHCCTVEERQQCCTSATHGSTPLSWTLLHFLGKIKRMKQMFQDRTTGGLEGLVVETGENLPGGNLFISAVVGRQSCLAPERAAVKSGGGFALFFSVAAASKLN